ncbi:UDP-glycosyltransferase 83A1-like [Neltuma alba]|uniref:UDP-glycosyltransferase 83A1-like n=1 Tax=Neltuma alba TaxID=207710 RepID=UPI0010A3A527|nr:UDP-glycosyltransferase 83A1-like [Prosopis alba]
MELSLELRKHGIKITFVNTDFNHKRIMKAIRATRGEEEGEEERVGNYQIKLVSIPGGLQQEEKKARPVDRLMDSGWQVMPEKLLKLIQEINESESEKISCVVADKAS